MKLTPEMEREIEAAAMAYSTGQFAFAESRTVSTYCNESTFSDAFDHGAHFGFQLAMEMLRGDRAGWDGPRYADFLEAKIKSDGSGG